MRVAKKDRHATAGEVVRNEAASLQVPNFTLTNAGSVTFTPPMRKVLVVGGDFDHNLGDSAALSALCNCLAAARPGLKITISSSKPQHLTLPGVVRLIPRALHSAHTLLSAARDQDLIIVGGGGLFQDDDSRAKMPFWASYLRVLHKINPNIVGLGLGVGPLQHRESRYCARVATDALKFISVRDEFARSWLSKCTDRPIELVPDLAFALPPSPPEAAEACLRSLGVELGRPIIGVAMRRWFHRLGGFIPHQVRSRVGLDRGYGNRELDFLLDQTAQVLRTLAKQLGASVLLMPTYNLRHEGDDHVSLKLMTKLQGINTHIFKTTDPQLYKAVTGKLSLMIAARMHPLILAASMGTPVVGMAYNGKFSGLFELLGYPQLLHWLKDSHKPDFASRLERMAHEALDTGPTIGARAAELAQVSQYHIQQLVSTAMWRRAGHSSYL